MTSRPQSTVSYNTEPFLKSVLDGLVERHVIQYYMYIPHKGEEGDKDHIHVFFMPNKRMDVMDIQDLFVEPLPGEKKPRRCLGFRPSKEEDWILYDLHDPEYLKAHDVDGNQDGKIEYPPEDMRYSEDFDFDNAYRRAKASQRSSAREISKKLRSGASARELVETGANPQLVSSIARIQRLDDNRALRNDLYRAEFKISQLCRYLEIILGFTVLYDEADYHHISPTHIVNLLGEVKDLDEVIEKET